MIRIGFTVIMLTGLKRAYEDDGVVVTAVECYCFLIHIIVASPNSAPVVFPKEY